MTDILITDTHFGIKQNSITWFNSQSNFIYKQLIPYIEDHKDVVRLIHLGDVFDSRSSISVLIAAKVKKIFADLARVCGQVIVIGGNHDYYSPNSNEYNSIELVLGDVPGITLVTRDILIDGNNMYVPWYEYDVGIIENKVREFNIKNVFVHNDIVNGDIPNINARLFSGHIHSPLFRTNKGLYNLVGGKLEEGENELDGAYRELEEETGITSSDISLKHVMNFEYKLLDMELELFAGRLNKEKELIEEVNKLYWIDANENFFDMNKFAGEGNIGHMLKHIELNLDMI